MKHLPALPLLLLASTLVAEDKPKPKEPPPAVKYVVPLVVEPTAKLKVTLRGGGLEAATAVSTTAEKVTVKLIGKGKKAGVPNNYPAGKYGETECEVELEIPKDYQGESVPLVVTTPAGKSEAYALLVARNRNVEKEPNDGLSTAQEITLPALVDGSIGREKDIDVFRFTGKKGQKVRIAVLAASLGSPADISFTLFDPDRQILAIVDDVDGKPDPSRTVTLPADGVYSLSVIEANDLGGSAFGYRLTVE